MEIAPKIQFRGMAPSPAVEARVRERIDGLAQYHPRITSCTVVLDAPHRHSRKGKIYCVSIDITIPGAELVVGKDAAANHAHEDVYVAIRDAFDAVTRQLEDAVRRMSGHGVKQHPAKLHGKIVRLMDDEGFGFIATADGNELFFPPREHGRRGLAPADHRHQGAVHRTRRGPGPARDGGKAGLTAGGRPPTTGAWQRNRLTRG